MQVAVFPIDGLADTNRKKWLFISISNTLYFLSKRNSTLTFLILVLSSLGAFFLFLDLPTYRRNLIFGKNNLKMFKNRLDRWRYQRKWQCFRSRAQNLERGRMTLPSGSPGIDNKLLYSDSPAHSQTYETCC